MDDTRLGDVVGAGDGTRPESGHRRDIDHHTTEPRATGPTG
jgi:hypothetical protein